jgi:hypothetical protein
VTTVVVSEILLCLSFADFLTGTGTGGALAFTRSCFTFGVVSNFYKSTAPELCLCLSWCDLSLVGLSVRGDFVFFVLKVINFRISKGLAEIESLLPLFLSFMIWC